MKSNSKNFERILKSVSNRNDKMDESDPYVFRSFNRYNREIISEKTIALFAGTAVPVNYPGISGNRLFWTLFYYFSNTRIYTVFDLVNEELGEHLDASFKKAVDQIRKGKKDLGHLFKMLRDNPISFIDTLSQFKTDTDYNYGDGSLIDFRLDFSAFEDLKNVKIVFANTENAAKALGMIFSRLNIDLPIITIPFFKHGITNEEVKDLLVSAIRDKRNH